jgi:hypothetical protein
MHLFPLNDLYINLEHLYRYSNDFMNKSAKKGLQNIAGIFIKQD